MWPIIGSSYFRPLVTYFWKIKRDIDMLPCLYDLDLFSFNTGLDCNLNPANQSFVRVLSPYYPPHSFRQMKTKLLEIENDTSFSVFRNNLNRNLENQTHILHEFDFILVPSDLRKQELLMLIPRCERQKYQGTHLNTFQRLCHLGSSDCYWWVAKVSHFRKDF